MKLGKQSIKPLSLLTAMLVVCQSIVPAGSVVAAPEVSSFSGQTAADSARSALFSLPSELGKVLEYHTPGVAAKDSPFIIHVQDAHSNPEAQENIKNIMGWISEEKTMGLGADKLIVALEGAIGSLHPEYLDFFKDHAEAGAKVVNHLRDLGELNGSDLFAWELYRKGQFNPDFFQGVEDAGLYRQNITTYRDLLENQSVIENQLKELRGLLDKASSRGLSKDVRAFLRERRQRKLGDYGTGQNAPQWNTYLNFLSKEAGEKLQIDLKNPFEQVRFPSIVRVLALGDISKAIDRVKAESQKAAFFKTLRAKNLTAAENADLDLFEKLPATDQLRALAEKVWTLAEKQNLHPENDVEFWHTVGERILASEVDAVGMAAEMKTLETWLLNAMIKSDDERRLVQMDSDFGLLEKLLTLKITRSDFADFLAARSGMETGVLAVGEEKTKTTINSWIEKAVSFYNMAGERDNALLANTLKAAAGKKAAVLISGGFHSEGLIELIKAKGLGYAVIQPKITRMDNGTLYRRAMLDQNSDVSAYFDKPYLTAQESLFLKELLEVGAPAFAADASVTTDVLSQEVAEVINRHPVLSGRIQASAKNENGTAGLRVDLKARSKEPVQAPVNFAGATIPKADLLVTPISRSALQSPLLTSPATNFALVAPVLGNAPGLLFDVKPIGKEVHFDQAASYVGAVQTALATAKSEMRIAADENTPIAEVAVQFPSDATFTRVAKSDGSEHKSRIVLERQGKKLELTGLRLHDQFYVKVGNGTYQLIANTAGKLGIDLTTLNPFGNPALTEFLEISPVTAKSLYKFPLPTEPASEGELARLTPVDSAIYPALVSGPVSAEQRQSARAFLNTWANQAEDQALVSGLAEGLQALGIAGVHGDVRDYYDAQEILNRLFNSTVFQEDRALIADIQNYLLLSYVGPYWDKWQKLGAELTAPKKTAAPARTQSVFERAPDAIRLPAGWTPENTEVIAAEALGEGSPEVKELATQAGNSAYDLGQNAISQAKVISLIFGGGSATTVKKVIGQNKLVHPALKVEVGQEQRFISLLQARLGLIEGQNEDSKVDIVTSVGGPVDGESDRDVFDDLSAVHADDVESGRTGVVKQRSGFALDQAGQVLKHPDGRVALVAENHLFALIALLTNKDRVIDHLKHTDGIIVAGNGDNILNYPRPGHVGEILQARQEGRALATVAITTLSAGDKKGGFAVKITYRNKVTGATHTQVEFREVGEFPTRADAQGEDQGYSGIKLDPVKDKAAYDFAAANGQFIEDMFRGKKVAFNVAFYANDLKLITARLFGLNENDEKLVEKLEAISPQEWVNRIFSVAAQVPATVQPAKGVPNEDASSTVKGYMTEQTVQDLIVNGLPLLNLAGASNPEVLIVSVNREDFFLPYKGTPQQPIDEAGQVVAGAPSEYDLVANMPRYVGVIRQLAEQGLFIDLGNGQIVKQVIPVTLDEVKQAVADGKASKPQHELFAARSEMRAPEWPIVVADPDEISNARHFDTKTGLPLGLAFVLKKPADPDEDEPAENIVYTFRISDDSFAALKEPRLPNEISYTLDTRPVGPSSAEFALSLERDLTVSGVRVSGKGNAVTEPVKTWFATTFSQKPLTEANIPPGAVVRAEMRATEMSAAIANQILTAAERLAAITGERKPLPEISDTERAQAKEWFRSTSQAVLDGTKTIDPKAWAWQVLPDTGDLAPTLIAFFNLAIRDNLVYSAINNPTRSEMRWERSPGTIGDSPEARSQMRIESAQRPLSTDLAAREYLDVAAAVELPGVARRIAGIAANILPSPETISAAFGITREQALGTIAHAAVIEALFAGVGAEAVSRIARKYLDNKDFQVLFAQNGPFYNIRDAINASDLENENTLIAFAVFLAMRQGRDNLRFYVEQDARAKADFAPDITREKLQNVLERLQLSPALANPEHIQFVARADIASVPRDFVNSLKGPTSKLTAALLSDNTDDLEVPFARGRALFNSKGVLSGTRLFLTPALLGAEDLDQATIIQLGLAASRLGGADALTAKVAAMIAELKATMKSA